MYGKIFASMFKGSLYGQWEAIVTFTCMIVLADQHGEVDMTAEALSAQTSIPLNIIKKGIAILEQPDPKSRTPGEDGRRIIRVSENRDWGWIITNYEHYRSIRSAEERREYMKQYQRKRRATKSTASKQPSTKSTKAVGSKQEAVGRGTKKRTTRPAAQERYGERHDGDAEPPYLTPFLEKFYADGPPRRADVIRQLQNTLQGGQPYNGSLVHAYDERHLERCVLEVVAGPEMRNPDAAVVVVLKKLAETYLEVKSAAEKAGEAPRPYGISAEDATQAGAVRLRTVLAQFKAEGTADATP